MDNSTSDPLFEILRTDRLTAVIDIGANPINGDPPYKRMLSSGLCTVIGFEPQANALAVLNENRGPRETYLPYTIGDGTEQILYICSDRGMTSLLPPDLNHLTLFNDFAQLGQVESTVRVATTRLDDVNEILEIDYLKMDAQGAELQILKSGERKLADAVVVQTEISFVTLYRGQSAFGVIDTTLREMGFIPHCLAELKHGPIAPMVINGNRRVALRQLLEADLVYVRDFSKANNFNAEQWKHLAMIMHHCYGSFDLALRSIYAAAQVGAVTPDAPERYLQCLQAQNGQSRWRWSKNRFAGPMSALGH